MKTSVVLTAIGEDRPGLVEALADTVARHGANWEASHMARLAGRFAGILLVTSPETAVDALVADLRKLGAESGLSVVVEPSAERDIEHEYRTLVLELVGHDRPGIIREISGALARRGVNVEELSSECTSAPMSGESLFRMTAIIQSPLSVSLDELTEELEGLANELMVDISLHDSV